MIHARLVLPALALGLAGCAGTPASEQVARYPAQDAPRGRAALAWLPAQAGRVVAIRTTRRGNGLSQEIVLAGPRAMVGENRISVEALTVVASGGPAAPGGDLVLGPASDAEIAAELAARLPGVRLRLSPVGDRNAMGPFGFASGVRGRLSCVYAWQYVAPSRPLTLIEGVTNRGANPVSLRVRLCREAPVATLIDDLRRLTLVEPGAQATEGDGIPGSGDALSSALGPASRSETAAARPPAAPVLRRRRVAKAHRPERRADGAAPRILLPSEVTAPPRDPAAPASPAADDLPMPR